MGKNLSGRFFLNIRYKSTRAYLLRFLVAILFLFGFLGVSVTTAYAEGDPPPPPETPVIVDLPGDVEQMQPSEDVQLDGVDPVVQELDLDAVVVESSECEAADNDLAQQDMDGECSSEEELPETEEIVDTDLSEDLNNSPAMDDEQDEDVVQDPIFCAGASSTDAPCAGTVRTNIQDAVDDASSAGVVYIEPGIFTDTVSIANKNFDLTFLGGVDLGSGTGTTTVDTSLFSISNSSGIIRFQDIIFSSTTPISISNSPNVRIFYSTPYTFSADVTLNNGNVTFEGSDITLDSNVSISGSGDVTVHAEDGDTATITDASQLSTREAKVRVDGSISTTGNITLLADVMRDVNIISTNNISLNSSSLSSIEIGSGAVLSGATVQLSARTFGNVISDAGANADAGNTFTESATVSIVQAATVNVTDLDLLAETAIQYSATGLVPSNNISGDVKAYIENTTATAGTGGVKLTAKDSSRLTATSPHLAINLNSPSLPISFATARANNKLDRNVAAYLKDATVTATNGDIELFAQRDTKLIAVAQSATLSGNNLQAGAFNLSLGGTFSVNTILGSVKAYIENGSASTINAGNILVDAKDTSIIDATSHLSAIVSKNSTFLNGPSLPPTSLLNPSSQIGISVALNFIGWDISNLFSLAISELLGAPLSTDEKEVVITAYIQDAVVTAADALSVLATSVARINATVSNAATSTVSGLYNAAGSSSSGILALNRISTRTRSLLSFTSASAQPMSAGGNVTVQAKDTSGIYSNAKIVVSSTVTNDGGAANVRALLNTYAINHEYKSTDGTQTVSFGERVLLDSAYPSAKGKANGVYEYMGTSASIILGSEDYTDYGYWKEIPAAEVIPQGNNITASSSVVHGGVVVLNAVQSEAIASLTKVNLMAANFLLEASETATITATVDSIATTSGGSAFGSGTVVARHGTIASNLIQADAKAYVDKGSVTTTGNLTINATNNSAITATNASALTSGDKAAGVILAFNTIGWKATNIFTLAIDALLGTNIGTADAAETFAYILDAVTHVTGNLKLTAVNTASILSTLSNEATSAASALFGAGGMATSGILASNMVNTSTKAYLKFSSALGVMDATDDITISASDTATINSSTTLQSFSTTTNDGGLSIISKLARMLLDNYKYTTNSGSPTINFGELVRLAPGYDTAKGTPGAIYQYMGTTTSLALGSQNYKDYTYWKVVDSSNVVPSGLNVSNSDAVGMGGLFVRNDVRSEVLAYVEKVDLEAQSISLSSIEDAEITAVVEGVVEASGGSAYGGGTVEAKYGAIVTNLVLSDAQAYFLNSNVVTLTGNLEVGAQNDSKIIADLSAAITSGDKAVGVMLAFNTIGWQAQNVLFNAIDALVGTDIGTEDPARTLAYLSNTPMTVAGNLLVHATNTTLIDAKVGNSAKSAASALINAGGSAAGAVLTSNMVSTETKAHITFTTLPATVNVNVTGNIDITASDESKISSEATLLVSSVTTNDGGASLLNNTVNFFLNDYQFTTASGIQDINTPNYDFKAVNGAANTRPVILGTIVKLDAAYTGGGEAGSAYSYIGAAASLNLNAQNYSNTLLWKPIKRTSSDKVRIGAGYTGGGDVGSVYRYIGTSAATLNLGTQNYNNGNWEKITSDSADFIPVVGNVTDSDAKATGGLVVRNDVRSNVSAYIEKAKVNAVNLTLTAQEAAIILSTATSTLEASGGSFYGSGTVVARNGTVATNLVLSSAKAYLSGSNITLAGALKLDAKNESRIDATVLASTGSGDTAQGVTMAFNTMGWNAQNLLFNAIDALIGSPEIAQAFHNENPVEVLAYLLDTVVNVTGSITIKAISHALLNATVSNAATSTASALFMATGKSLSAVLASNMVSSLAKAFIEFTSTPGTIVSGGLLTIFAQDQAGIYSNSKMVSSSITTNDGGVNILDESLKDLVPADFATSEGLRDVKFGSRVRLADAYANGGTPGSVYEYMGETETSINLSNENYSNLSFWNEVYETQLVPLGLNFSKSDAIGLGGLVVRNEVRSEVAAYIKNAVVTTSADLNITALESAIIRANIDSSAVSSGGSAFGEGKSIAVNGVIATNLVLSEASAYITGSTVTTLSGGNLNLTARNISQVNATVLSSMSTGDKGLGATLAFNTVGWDAQNVLFNAIDALIGSTDIANAFHNSDPALTQAYIYNSTLSIAGDLTLTAESQAQLFDFTGAITTTKLNDAAVADEDNPATNLTDEAATDKAADQFILNDLKSQFSSHSITIYGDLAVTVLSPTKWLLTDSMGSSYVVVNESGVLKVAESSLINASIDNQATSAASALINANGTSVGGVLASNLVNTITRTYISSSPQVDVGGNLKMSANDNASINADGNLMVSQKTTNDGGLSIALNVANTYLSQYQFTTKSGTQDVYNGMQVRVADDYGFINQRGKIYQYVGAPAVADGEDPIAVSVNIGTQDFSGANAASWDEITDLNSLVGKLPFPLNVTDSNSVAVGGLVVRNEVQSQAESKIVNSTVDVTGNGTITADADAFMRAVDISSVTSSGGSIFGKGKSVAVNGVIATNLVLSKANAFIQGSDVTFGGSLSVDAQNTSTLDAVVKNTTKSNKVSVGVTLAFNTIGWLAQNFLFNTVDALIGTTLGTQQPAETQAYISSTNVQVGNGLSLNSVSNAAVHAAITSSTTSIVATLGNGTSVSVGAVIALNKVSTKVQAYMDGAPVVNVTSGDISLSADDHASIWTDVKATSLSVSANVGKSTSISVGLSISRNQINADAQAYINNSGVTANAGNITLTATERSEIDAIASASAVAVAASAAGATSFSGGGAMSTNHIQGKTKAYAANSTLTAQGAGNGDLTISASNTANIDVHVKASSIAVGAGIGTSPGISIGVSIARNFIGWSESGAATPFEVKAYLQGSDVLAANGIALSAISNSIITATVDAMSVGAALSAGAGISVSAAGLWVENKISILVEAYINEIKSTGVRAVAGHLTLLAKDISSITATALSASLAASFSPAGSGAFAIGLSLARNIIQNDVAAYILGANPVSTSAGNISLTAFTDSTIDTWAAAAAASVAIAGTTGISFSGAGAFADNIINSDTLAYVKNSRITNATHITFVANNISKITATVATVAIAAGVGGGVGAGIAIGASVARNLIGYDDNANLQYSKVQTYIENSTINASGLVSLTATSTETIKTTVLAGSVAVAGSGGTAIGASGSGTSATNKIAMQVESFITGGLSDITAGSLTLAARENSTITAIAGSAAIAASFAGSVGVSLSVGVAIAESNITNQVKAYISNAAHVLTLSGGVLLDATETAIITTTSAAASAAAAIAPAGVAISGGVTTAKNTITNIVKAYISNVTDLTSALGVSLSAKDTSIISAELLSVSLAIAPIGVAVGLALTENSINNNVSAYINNSSVAANNGGISVTALFQPGITTKGRVAAISVSLGVGGVGAESKTVIGGNTQAYVDASTLSAPNGDISVQATTIASATPVFSSLSGGLVAIAILKPTAQVSGATTAYVSGGSDIQGKNINIQATSNGTADVTLTRVGGGLVSVAILSTEATALNTSLVNIQDSSTLTATNNISIISSNTSTANAYSKTDGGALVDIGDASAKGIITSSSAVTVENGTVTITAAKDLLVQALSNVSATATAKADTAGLGTNSNTVTNVTVNTSAKTTINTGSKLNGRDTTIQAVVTGININALSDSRADALGADSDAASTVTTTSEASIYVAANTKLYGEITTNLAARHDSLLTYAKGRAETNGAGGDTDATASNTLNTTTNITTLTGSVIETRHLLVEANAPYQPTFSAVAQNYGALIDMGEATVTPTLTLNRTLDFNSHVIMLGAESPKLVIDANGNIVEQVNVSVDNTNPARVIVADINNDTFWGTITFRVATSIFDLLSATDLAAYGTVTATNKLQGHATFEFRTTLEYISLINKSLKDLIINNIRVLNLNGQLNSLITIDVRDHASFSYDSLNAPGVTPITIQNIDDPLAPRDPSSIELRGIINPSCYQRWLIDTATTKRATFSSKPLAVTA